MTTPLSAFKIDVIRMRSGGCIPGISGEGRRYRTAVGRCCHILLGTVPVLKDKILSLTVGEGRRDFHRVGGITAGIVLNIRAIHSHGRHIRHGRDAYGGIAVMSAVIGAHHQGMRLTVIDQSGEGGFLHGTWTVTDRFGSLWMQHIVPIILQLGAVLIRQGSGYIQAEGRYVTRGSGYRRHSYTENRCARSHETAGSLTTFIHVMCIRFGKFGC